MSKLSETMREYNYGATGATIMGWSIQVAGLEDRNEALETALRQCERTLRMPWLNTYKESEEALRLIDSVLARKETTR